MAVFSTCALLQNFHLIPNKIKILWMNVCTSLTLIREQWTILMSVTVVDCCSINICLNPPKKNYGVMCVGAWSTEKSYLGPKQDRT